MLPDTPTICCIILTRDEEKHIAACLDTLAWADERLVLDSGSADATVALARQAGVRVEQRAWRNFPDQRNAALEMTTCPWVFFLDADERCTPELASEIRAAVQDPGNQGFRDSAQDPRSDNPQSKIKNPKLVPSEREGSKIPGYWVPRHNIIFGQIIHHTGWYPDYQPRLFRRGFGRFDPARIVHELPIFDGQAGYLTQPLIHYNYATVGQFLARQFRYADYDVQRLHDQGIRPRFWAPLLQPLRQFRRRFFALQGYLDGGHGLLLSVLMAYYDYVVYSRLRALGRLEPDPAHTPA